MTVITIDNMVFATNYFIYLYPLIALAIAFSILFFRKYKKKQKLSGARGEKIVARRLASLAKRYGGYVINDIIIPTGPNGTTQVDHIYFTNKAIFVIETKDYSGRIYGTANQKEWTQVLAYGNEKHKLYNPILQNKTHVNALSELLNYPGSIEPLVVFIDSDISKVEAYNVINIRHLKLVIKNFIKFKRDDIDTEPYYQKIKHYKDNPIKTIQEHVDLINSRKELSENGYCPYCGLPLALKYSEKTKGHFMDALIIRSVNTLRTNNLAL